jgi:hypothetical protein
MTFHSDNTTPRWSGLFDKNADPLGSNKISNVKSQQSIGPPEHCRFEYHFITGISQKWTPAVSQINGFTDEAKCVDEVDHFVDANATQLRDFRSKQNFFVLQYKRHRD